MMKMTWMSTVMFLSLMAGPVFSAWSAAQSTSDIGPHQAQVGQNPHDKLNFVWSEEVLHYPGDIIHPDVNGVLPGFAAQVFIAHWSGQGRKLLLTQGLSHFSQEQQAFMTRRPFYQEVCTQGTAYEGYHQIRLYAVSREQAGKMAYFMIDTLTRRAQQRRARLLQEKGRLAARIKANEQNRPRLAQQLDTLHRAFTQLTDSDRYRSLAAQDAAQIAQQRIVALTAQSDRVRAESAQCQAILSSSKKHLAGIQDVNSPGADRIMTRLKGLAAEQQVRLDGLQARSQVIEQTLTGERKLRQLYVQMQDLQQRQRRIGQALDKDRDRLTDLTHQLTDPQPGLWKPVVFKNRVEICAVQCPHGRRR